MSSIWQNEISLPQFPALEQDKKTDVLIIGGGMAGVLCTHFLKEQGVDCMLAEASTVGSGITKNTTAKITAQHGLIYGKLLRTVGVAGAAAYLSVNQQALEIFRALAANIHCDFEERDAYVYDRSGTRALKQEVAALQQLGFPAELIHTLSLPFPVAGGVRFPKQAQFHPLKFLGAVAKNLPIYEHTAVRELGEHKAVCDKGTITAGKIIVATHFPMLNKHGSYFVKLYQHRSYVIALENAQQVDGMYLDQAKNGMSFRNYGNLLLIGGGDHRTGKRGGNWTELREFASKYYPRAKEKSHWATQDCMSLDGLPYIGPYSARTKDLFLATGFNKWGMTSSMVSAMILSRMVLGETVPEAALFSPSRSILKPQLLANAFEATVNLLTPTRKRCPHLGCALKWNKAEHSWDCPCHGSRFTENGKLIDNPATGDLSLKY